MKIKKVTALVAALGLSASAASAAHVWEDPSGWWDNHFTTSRASQSKFHAKEISMDLFATYTAQERGIEDVFKTNIRETDNDSTSWGGGVGLNYFFTEVIGLGADINIPDNDGKFIDSGSMSLIARFPWESAGLAPYIFGGGGREAEPVWQWSVHAGAGLEWRFNSITGIFADARYVWADDSNPDGVGGKFDGDYVLMRAGVRLAF